MFQAYFNPIIDASTASIYDEDKMRSIPGALSFPQNPHWKFTHVFGVPQGPEWVTIDCFMSQSYSNLTNDDSTEAIYGEDKIKRLPGPSDTPPPTVKFTTLLGVPQGPVYVTIDCFMSQSYSNLTNDDSTEAIYGEDKIKRLPGPSDTPPLLSNLPLFLVFPKVLLCYYWLFHVSSIL